MMRPLAILASDLMGVFLGVRGLRGVVSFLGVCSLEAVYVVVAPRAGASGRVPVSISSLSTAASRLIIRKRPSMES